MPKPLPLPMVEIRATTGAIIIVCPWCRQEIGARNVGVLAHTLPNHVSTHREVPGHTRRLWLSEAEHAARLTLGMQ